MCCFLCHVTIQLGANGYAFAVSHNGFVVFHPGLRMIQVYEVILHYCTGFSLSSAREIQRKNPYYFANLSSFYFLEAVLRHRAEKFSRFYYTKRPFCIAQCDPQKKWGKYRIFAIFGLEDFQKVPILAQNSLHHQSEIHAALVQLSTDSRGILKFSEGVRCETSLKGKKPF